MNPKGKAARSAMHGEGHSNLQPLVDALSAMIAAVALDKASGSYRIAARHLEEIAQIYEDKLDEQQKAYDYYDDAANLYQADNSPTYVITQRVLICTLDSNDCFDLGWQIDAPSKRRNWQRSWAIMSKPYPNLSQSRLLV